MNISCVFTDHYNISRPHPDLPRIHTNLVRVLSNSNVVMFLLAALHVQLLKLLALTISLHMICEQCSRAKAGTICHHNTEQVWHSDCLEECN